MIERQLVDRYRPATDSMFELAAFDRVVPGRVNCHRPIRGSRRCHHNKRPFTHRVLDYVLRAGKAFRGT